MLLLEDVVVIPPLPLMLPQPAQPIGLALEREGLQEGQEEVKNGEANLADQEDSSDDDDDEQLDISADLACEGPVRFSDPADRSPLEQKLQLAASRGLMK